MVEGARKQLDTGTLEEVMEFAILQGKRQA